jgi:hypothetical protein
LPLLFPVGAAFDALDFPGAFSDRFIVS